MNARTRGSIRYRYTVTPGDTELVEEIVLSTQNFHPDEVGVARELVEAYLEKKKASGYRLVFAQLNGSVLGYGCFGPIAGSDRRFTLYWIAVYRIFHGCGVGTAILKQCEEAIVREGGVRVFIETSSQPSYANARGFYARNGYLCTATIEGYYSDTDARLVYAKNLPDPTPRQGGGRAAPPLDHGLF